MGVFTIARLFQVLGETQELGPAIRVDLGEAEKVV